MILALSSLLAAQAALPPVPVPPGNPMTPEKVVLGKLLYWDEQLSSDHTVACGTCHLLDAGGADPRDAVHPGPDNQIGTDDDVAGSLGVLPMTPDGAYTSAPGWGTNPQVTARAAQTLYSSAWAPRTFWDGRAGPEFVDPITGAVRLQQNGALEAQAIGPILNSVEMSHPDRSWVDVALQLTDATPLALAANVPGDLAPLLSTNPTYGDLFEVAFGDDAVTPDRIGFAIASYQRTLIPDQSVFDDFDNGVPNALTAQQLQGFQTFRVARCAGCHPPPLFTDHTFRNVGVRPSVEDPGRQGVTGNPADAGRFKTPSLRNIGSRQHFMHNGAFSTLEEVVDFYLGTFGTQFDDNLDPVLAPINLSPAERTALLVFLRETLDDPRVDARTGPFSRPDLHAAPDACNDGIDNDGDGLSDAQDPGCFSPGDTSELAWDLACDDGIDNDGDGLVDSADADCDDLCQGDDTTGDRDGDGLCDDLDLVLQASGLRAGEPIHMDSFGAPPGADVFVLMSLQGPGQGPCHPTAGICADIVAPTVVGRRADLVVTPPPNVPPGTQIWLQSAWIDGAAGQTSNVVRRVVVD
jgi:cytochrome c peroxidase